jgi:hypothetical protein
MNQVITIRHSTAADADALRQLAELDGRRAFDGDAIMAYVDGQLRAAIGIPDGRSIADPFHLTDDLVGLLRLRFAQEHSDSEVAYLGRLARFSRAGAGRGLRRAPVSASSAAVQPRVAR